MNEKTLSIIVKAQDRASKVFDTIGSRVSLAASKITQMAAVGVAAASTAIAGLGVAAIKSAGEYEQARVSFDTMLGSAAAGRKMLQDLTNFALRTPFQVPDVIAGAKQILAYGVAAKDVIPDMEALGNIAAGVGRDKLPFLTLAFGQVAAKGKLMGQEIRQFAEAGVPIVQELAKNLHKSTDEILSMSENGQISFDDTKKALMGMTSEGGKFNNLMIKQSHTFGGVVSNIKDSFGMMLRSAVGITQGGDIVAGGFFDRIKAAAEKVLPVLQSFSKQVGPAMASLMAFLGSLKDGFVSVMTVVDKMFGPSLIALWNTISTKLAPAFERLLPFLKIVAIVLGVVVVAAIWVLINVLNVLANVLSWVIQVVANVARWFVDRWNNIVSVWSKAFGFFSSVGGAIKNAFSLALNYVRDRWSGIVGFFSGIASRISSVVGGIQKTLTAPFVGAYDFIKSLPKKMVDLFAGLGGMIRTAIGNIDIPGPLGKIKDVIPGFANGTSYAPGGLAVVGERGPELVNLPRGSQVFSNQQSRAMAGSTINIYGAINLGSQDAVNAFFARLDAQREMAALGVGV